MPESSLRSPDDALTDLIGEVARSPTPVLLLRLPHKEIIAASTAAVNALTGDEPWSDQHTSHRARPRLEGQCLDSLLADPPSAAAELLLAGNISRCDVLRTVRRGGNRVGVTFRFQRVDWLPDVVVAAVDVGVPPARATAVPVVAPIVGSADSNLVIDQISSGVEAFVGETANDVVGRSLLSVIKVADVASILRVIAGRHASGRCVSTTARMRGRNTISQVGQLVVLARNPAPSCIFTFTLAALLSPARDALLGGKETLSPAGPAPPPDGPTGPAAGIGDYRTLLDRLTQREAEIVLRLVRGDRVPAIARDLFLAQATVRNHLSAAYRKLGVSSQQGVVDLFRE